GVRAVAEHRLRWAGLPVPAVMVCADEIRNGKPDPEGYLTAAKRLGVAPAQCIVVEDAPAGIQAAHAGGMRVIAIATTHERAQLAGADAIVGTLADIRAETNSELTRLEVVILD